MSRSVAVARWLTMMLAVTASAAFAEDEAQRRAREELEKQLNQMVGSAPSRVRVEFQSVDDPNFKVEEFEVSVDGKPIKPPSLEAIAGWLQDGPMPIGSTDVAPGQHKVTAKVTLHNTASALATEEGDHRWKLAGDVSFEVSRGLEVKVVVTTSRDPKQADVGKRLRISFPSQPLMISKLEDGTMPEPIKPNLAPAVVDAGTRVLVTAVDPAKKTEDPTQAAADEKKRKAEEALAAKQAAADEKKRKAEAALAAKQAAADEKKRKAEEALAAKKAAAEEKKRKAEEAIAAKQAAAEEKKRQAEEAVAAKAAAAAEEARRKADAVIAKQDDSQAKPGDALAAIDAGEAPPVAAVETADAGAVVA